MFRTRIDREGAKTASAARALAASALVIGLASLLWLHADRAGVAPAESTPSISGDCAASDCLHAPAGDPSVPAADRVFARSVASDALPPVPTF